LTKGEFKQMCENHGTKAILTTSHNPQANAIIERVYKVVNNMLRPFDLESNYENLDEKEDNPFDYFLQLTECTIRRISHTKLQETP
jgi:transposase InsO family protein